MKVKYFFWISLVVTLLFFVSSYFVYEYLGVLLPLERALLLTFSFLGSVGTIASIMFAIYFYKNQQNEQKNTIKSNQPIFMLLTSVLEKSSDSMGQLSYSLNISIKNYGHLASSFSLIYLNHTENIDHKNLVELSDNSISFFDRDNSYDVKVNISSVSNVGSFPAIENISIDLLSYIDKFNSSKYEVYTLSINKDHKPKLMHVKEHNLLSFNR